MLAYLILLAGPETVKSYRTLILAGMVLAACVVLFLWMRSGGGPEVVIDLVDAFPEAEKRTNAPSLDMAFALEEVTIAGVRKRCIYATPEARIIWSVVMPDAARLETSFGMREDSWDKLHSNGAQFRIGISDGVEYTELLRQVVDPTSNQSDRRWQSVTLDLGRYAGRQVQVIFNTDPGPPGDGNTAYDFSVWGEPRIVGRK